MNEKECKKVVLERPKGRKLPVKERKKGFSPVEFGLTEEEAVREANRCLGSRTCESCDLCSLLCPDLCITRDETTGNVVLDLDYCKGCAICAAVCPKGAIRMILEE
jgi:2-oxoacid:acceptor oxidoreductase delta subunit (pyruvate/2-ketoisovalerate family)